MMFTTKFLGDKTQTPRVSYCQYETHIPTFYAKEIHNPYIIESGFDNLQMESHKALTTEIVLS
jgi:hypothetical protein